MRVVGLCCSVLGLTLMAVHAPSQIVTGTLYGTVVDPNGAVVPGGVVTVLNVGRGSSLARTTDNLGEASFASLPVGEYSITVEARGFKSLRRSGITLSGGQEVRLTLSLEIGQVAETIEVRAETPLVNTSNAEQRSNLEAARVQDLPTFRRDWTNLLNLTTGAQVSGGSVRLNGLAPSSLRVTVDGTDATQDTEQPSFSMSGNFNFIKGVSTEAIAEVNLAKGIASAEIANTISGNVNIITKSGTNQVHGSVFWLNNLENFNARNQFLATRPGIVYNQFGGSLGGPVIRNKVFLFGTYDGYRQRGFQPLNEQVPTAEFRARINAATPIYSKVLSIFPLPTQPYAATSNTGAWVGAGTEQGEDDHAVLRGDYNVASGTIITGRYNRARPFRLTPRVVVANNRTWVGTIEQGNLNVTHARPRWTFETRLGYNYNRVPRVDHYADLYTTDPAYGGIRGLGFSVDGEFLARKGYTYSLEESVGTTVGRHSLKFGGLYMTNHVNRNNFQTPSITYSSVDDLINNLPSAGQITMGLSEYDLYFNTFGFFLQDDFKINRRLVVNMGARWDYFSVPKERDGRLFNRAQPFGSGPYLPPDQIWNPDRNNFSPRLGFAYQLMGNGKSVLRGGAGVFHSPVPLFGGGVDIIRDSLEFPFRITYGRPEVLANGNIFRWPVSNSVVREYIRGRPTLIGDTAYNTNFPSPMSYQWQFGIQQELMKELVLDVAYVGTRGRNLQMVRFWNQVNRATGVRPYQGFSEYRYRDAADSSLFHSLQASVRKRYSADFSIGAAYTWASAFSYTNQSDLLLPASVQDIYNIRADKGPPDGFVKHNFVTDFVYELPFRKLTDSSSLWARNLVRGWQVSGIFTAQSGTPVNIAQTTAFEGSRADYVGAGGATKFDDYQDTLRYLNRAAFALVPIGSQSGAPLRPGNVGRNAFWNIGFWNLDLATTKRFAITERLEGKLEAQMLNALNHTSLSGLSSNVTSSNFGMFTSTRGARVIQLNLRFAF